MTADATGACEAQRVCVEYVLLSGFFIHARNQPAVTSLQPGTPALHASEMAFLSLCLQQNNVMKGSEERWGTSGIQAEASRL